ncbi:hypothetical protein [Streptomyces rubellomurinus]|uniref:hypothetical protein n=1 Tax=Streptomyces rubellomurinus (strain ATCC 31215) TaxID=359131 RepID=UPI000ADA7729|nr:hypothetical protein [Streptomyces rubellomurinus]
MTVRRRSWAVAMRGRTTDRRHPPHEEPDRSPLDGSGSPHPRPSIADAPAAGRDDEDRPEPPAADTAAP